MSLSPCGTRANTRVIVGLSRDSLRERSLCSCYRNGCKVGWRSRGDTFQFGLGGGGGKADLSYVADVSKKAQEGKETAGECAKTKEGMK